MLGGGLQSSAGFIIAARLILLVDIHGGELGWV
jgi:hypothetical protein